MIMQYLDQSPVIRQGKDGQLQQQEPQYILTFLPTAGTVSQQPIVARVMSPTLSFASWSQIRTITSETPARLAQFSLTELGYVSLNLSVGATALPITPTTLLEGNKKLVVLAFLSTSLGRFHASRNRFFSC